MSNEEPLDVMTRVLFEQLPSAVGGHRGFAQHIVTRQLAALGSAGFQVFRTEDCKSVDLLGDEDGAVVERTYFLVPEEEAGL